MRAERRSLAFCSSARRLAANPRPARFMKYVSIRRPDPGPFGETFLEARVRAMVAALFVNNPDGGCVESVLTLDTHLFPVCLGISLIRKSASPRGRHPRPPGRNTECRVVLAAHPSTKLTCWDFDAGCLISVVGNLRPWLVIPEPSLRTACKYWLNCGSVEA
jgi:hypothetical protein